MNTIQSNLSTATTATTAAAKAAATTPVSEKIKSVTKKQFADSLALVVSMLSQKKVSNSQLQDMKYSEEILYAAHVRARLVNESLITAKTFDEELKIRLDRRTARNDTHALPKAINDILDNALKAGELSIPQQTAIVSESLGKSQLDTSKSALSNKVVSGGVEKAAVLLTTNKIATTSQFNSFQKTVSKVAFQSPAETRSQTAKREEIFQSTGKKAVESDSPIIGTTATTTTEKSNTQKSDEISSKTTLIDPTRNSSPNNFDYRPKSDHDGKLLLRLPVNFGENIRSIKLKDKQGTVIEEQPLREKGNDGRLYFRFKNSGDMYGPTFSANIVYADESELSLKISNSGENATVHYRPD